MVLKKRASRRVVARAALALALIALPLCSGCGTFLTLLRVDASGGGTVEQTVQLSPMAAQFMSSMANDSTGQAASPLEQMFDEDSLRAAAADLGEGVRFESVERLDNQRGKGARVRYAFDDVRTVRLPSQPIMDDGDADSNAPVTFGFEAGPPATLTMRLPPGLSTPAPDAGLQSAAVDSAKVAEQMQMMRMMFTDALVRVAVAPQGAVASTDATHRREDGSVTLLEMDFNELMADEAAFRRVLMAQTQDLSPAERERLMREAPGITAEPQETVTLRFR